MSSTAPSIAEQQNLIHEIHELFIKRFSIRVDPAVEVDLFQAGILDSMSLVQLILGLEERFGLQFPIEELELDSFRSLSNIAELVFNRKQLKAIGPPNG